MTDNDKAIQEAERNEAIEEYFWNRMWLKTQDNVKLFKAGFDHAYSLLSKLRAEDAQASDERAAFEAYVQKRFGGLAEPWDANAARYPYGPDQARCEAWRAALAWYAEQVAGCRKIGADGDAARQALDKDGGRRARAALASAPVADEQQAVAYLDLGAGGYVDVGTDLTDEQLAALPKGRHMLAIIGTHGVDGYTPASAPVADESPMAKMADALREKARQEQQAYQDRRNQATEWGPIPEGTEADRPIPNCSCSTRRGR